MPAVGQTRAYLALTLVVALWGSYPAFAKLALLHFPPFVLVTFRSMEGNDRAPPCEARVISTWGSGQCR